MTSRPIGFVSAAAVASGCVGKERFTSYALAARTASKSAHRNGVALEAYACAHCGCFHVGGTRGPRTGAIRSSAVVRHRCEACRRAGDSYCPHHGVLVIHIDETANRLRVKLKGKPFNPPRVKR